SDWNKMILFILCCLSLHITLVSGMKSLPECSLVSKSNGSKPLNSLSISCSHSIPDYDRVLWYKQSKLHEMKLLGYMLGDNGYPEKDGDRGETCTLTIKELSEKSSAVYYCAASYHSAEYHCCSVQKPPHRCSCVSCGDLIVLGFSSID
uniref:Ig-like domain-containing protein n=1 Tax=Xiphophorus couchianus TaxID=32473 RepID=A0A3B5KYN5_9TELE